MRVEVNDVGVDHAVENLRRIEGLQVGELALEHLHHGVFQRGAKLLDVTHGDRVNDGLLVGKEAVERADRQPGLGGDPGGGDVLQRHLLQQGTGGIKNALDGLLAARLHRRRRGEAGATTSVGMIGSS